MLRLLLRRGAAFDDAPGIIGTSYLLGLVGAQELGSALTAFQLRCGSSSSGGGEAPPPAERPPRLARPPRSPAHKQPAQQAGQPAARHNISPGRQWQGPSPSDVAAQTSCAAVLTLLADQPIQRIQNYTLSKALDHMKTVCSNPGSPPAEDKSAVRQLLGLATQRLPNLHPRGLAAYIRCAAAFKGLLEPAGLEAWQAALGQPGLVQQLTAQEASNSLLSWGTLAASDTQLAAAVDRRLAAQLLQHVVSLAAQPTDFPVRHACEALYSAALLQLRPSVSQTAALFRIVGQGVARLHYIDLTQLLLACDKLTAAGRDEALPPSEDPFFIYYPGDGLMAALLDRTRRLGPGLSMQAAAQIVGACGGLGYRPHEAAWRALLAVVAGQRGIIKGIDAATILMGCAELGEHPGPAVLRACFVTVEREHGIISQHVANAVWALAVLQACSPAEWATLAELLAGHPSPDNVHLIQWYQAYLLVEEQHRRTSTGANVACPPDLLQRSRAAWEAGQLGTAVKGPTLFHAALKTAVRQLVGPGQEVAVEHPVRGPLGEGPLLVDVALPGLRLALEADGPSHFLRNVPGQATGRTLARDRLLRGWGWEVVSVAYTITHVLQMGGKDPPFEVLVAGLRRHLEREHPALVARIRRGGVGAAGAE